MSNEKIIPPSQAACPAVAVRMLNVPAKSQTFPDYSHFGINEGMAHHIEREVGILHFNVVPADEKELVEIAEKNKKASRHEQYPKENGFLQRILTIVKRKVKENELMYFENMDDVIRRGNRGAGRDDWSDDPVMKGKMLAKMAAQNRNQYKRSEKTPYFGKVIFKLDSASRPMELYFGKAAVDLEGETARVIDWRAPVADLYYKYTGAVKNAFYQVNERRFPGELELKRQISIEEGLITMISDGNLNEVIKELEEAQIGEDSTDEILISNLDKSAHKRLGEIVATIQSEQNDIIRAPINKITLVQGVAGAGKTTIALHRLAYIMYNHPDEIRPDNVTVIAPNDVFLDYISKVLPDLGVENINQTTIENFLLEYVELPEGASFLDKMEISARSYDDKAFDEKISSMRQIKCNLDVLELIDTLHLKLESLVARAFQDNPYYTIHSGKVNEKYIRQLFYENRNMPWEKRLDYIKNRLHILIEDEMKELSMNAKTGRERAKSEIENLDEFLSTIEYPSLIEAYKMLFSLDEIKEIPLTRGTAGVENTIETILSDIDQNIIYSDDLPLLYKISELYKEKKKQSFDYVVIDEAQDLSTLELQVLKENTKENKLCIVGDINQTIHDKSRYPTLVEQMSVVFGDEHFSFHKLLKSYRSTIEITNFANNVLKDLNAAHIALPVIRHGIDPIIKMTNQNNLKEEIKDIIKTARERGRKSIVITARTESSVKNIFGLLKDEVENISFMSKEKKNYELGVHVIPSYLTKGLEFDTVIVVKDNNHEKTEQELRLEYVMYTRALHELYVLETN